MPKPELTQEQYIGLLEEIADAVVLADEFCQYVRGNSESMPTPVWVLEDYVKKIGWLADIGLGGDNRGGAEEWLLSPRWNDLRSGGSDA